MNGDEIRTNPLNVKGKYFVEQNVCLDHELCIKEAPHNFRMDTGEWCAYVFKQPASPAEEAQCKAAMEICPVEAIHDVGELRSTPQD